MDKLVATATSTRTNTAIVVVLRADYYGMCGAHPAFARLLERSQVLVGAMSASELRDAIIEPAAHMGLRVDDALVEVVCRDAGSEPGALPLVSTALAETWVHREDHTLTVAAYENAGGVQGALARLADRAYERLDASQRVVARRIFSRLAEVGEGNDDVRRRAARSEIDAIEGASEVLAILTAHRLVTADRDRVEVAHEALLREWPRLRGWLEDDRDGRRLHQRLAEAASEWERDAREPAVLYRGTKLDAAAEWSGSHPDELTSTETSFVAASAAAQADDLQVARRSARRSRLMVTGLTVLLVVALVSAAVTVRQWHRATNASSRAGTAARSAELGRLDALARNLPTDSGDLALLLGVEAHRLAPSVETEGALESALVHSPPGLERIIRFDSPTFYPTPSPDGRLLAFAGGGDVRLLDLQSGRVVRTLHSDHPLTGAFFNADGTELASRSSDGTAIVWDAATGRPVGASIRSPGSLVYPEFDPADPSGLYTVSDLGEVVRWDRHDPAHPRRIGEPFRFPLQTIKGSPPVIAFAPDGGLLAVAPTNGDASTTAVWDVRRHALLQTFSGTPYGFAPDGTTLVLSNGRDLEFRDARSGALRGKPQHGSGDAQPGGLLSADRRLVAVRNGNDTIDVYDLASRKRIGKPLGVPASSLPTSFLPDGRLIVSTPTQASIWRVDTRVGALGVGLNDHGHQVIAWFVHDGQRVVTQSWDDGVTTSWDVGTGRRVGALAHGRPVQDVSRDGRFASVGLSGGDVGVWDLASDRQVAMIDPHLGSQDASAFAPNGSLLAIAATHGHDPTVELWDVTDPGSAKIYKRLTVSSADGLVTGFSDDNRSLLVIDYPSSWITLFDVASGQRRWTHQFDAGMWQVTTSPDSHTVAVALNGLTDSGVRFLDARTGKEEALLPSPEAIGVAYARRGRVIAVSGGINPSGTQLFDAATLARIGEPLPTPGATPFLVGSSPDGNRLAAGTGNGFAVLWDVDVEHWEQRACQIAGRNLSRDEWHQYVPDQSYRRTCPQWPAGQ